MSGLIQIATFQNGVEADLARLLLESHGFDVRLFDDAMGYLGLGSILPMRLMVPPSQAEEAIAILGDEGVL